MALPPDGIPTFSIEWADNLDAILGPDITIPTKNFMQGLASPSIGRHVQGTLVAILDDFL